MYWTIAAVPRLTQLYLLVQVQVEMAQLPALTPMPLDSGAGLLVHHCGRPDAGFSNLLPLTKSRRATVKLSGLSKFSAKAFSFADARLFVAALLQGFGADHCIWTKPRQLFGFV